MSSSFMAYSILIRRNEVEEQQSTLYNLIRNWVNSLPQQTNYHDKILELEPSSVHYDQNNYEIYGFFWYGIYGNPGKLIKASTGEQIANITEDDAPTHSYFFYFGKYVGNSMLFLLEKKSNFSFYTPVEKNLNDYVKNQNYKLDIVPIQSKKLLLEWLERGSLKSISIIKLHPDVSRDLLGELERDDIELETVIKAKKNKFFSRSIKQSFKDYLNGDENQVNQFLGSYYNPEDSKLKVELKIGKKIRNVYISPEATNIRSLFEIDTDVILYGPDNQPNLDAFLAEARSLKEELINTYARIDQERT